MLRKPSSCFSIMLCQDLHLFLLLLSTVTEARGDFLFLPSLPISSDQRLLFPFMFAFISGQAEKKVYCKSTKCDKPGNIINVDKSHAFLIFTCHLMMKNLPFLLFFPLHPLQLLLIYFQIRYVFFKTITKSCKITIAEVIIQYV